MVLAERRADTGCGRAMAVRGMGAVAGPARTRWSWGAMSVVTYGVEGGESGLVAGLQDRAARPQSVVGGGTERLWVASSRRVMAVRRLGPPR